MYRLLLISSLLLLPATISRAKTSADSTHTVVVVPRLNSAGYFPFTGALLNHNTNFDLNAVYENKIAGFLAFKSFDLQDSKSPINYLQSAVFKQISISKSVNIGLYAGYLFSQTKSFKDKSDSDYFGALTTYWDVNKQLRLENILLFNDPSTQGKIVNRILVLYKLKKFRFDLSIHERYVFETRSSSTSASLAINLPRVELTKHLSVGSSVAYQSYLTTARPDFALKNGFLFSISFPFACKI